MITKSNLKNMLSSAGFSGTSNDKYEKNYPLNRGAIRKHEKNQ